MHARDMSRLHAHCRSSHVKTTFSHSPLVLTRPIYTRHTIHSTSSSRLLITNRSCSAHRHDLARDTFWKVLPAISTVKVTASLPVVCCLTQVICKLLFFFGWRGEGHPSVLCDRTQLDTSNLVSPNESSIYWTYGLEYQVFSKKKKS